MAHPSPGQPCDALPPRYGVTPCVLPPGHKGMHFDPEEGGWFDGDTSMSPYAVRDENSRVVDVVVPTEIRERAVHSGWKRPAAGR